MEEKESLIRLSTLLEGLGIKVKEVSDKIDGIKDGFIADARTKIGILETKVSRLESIIYTAGVIIFGQLIGLIFLYLKK